MIDHAQAANARLRELSGGALGPAHHPHVTLQRYVRRISTPFTAVDRVMNQGGRLSGLRCGYYISISTAWAWRRRHRPRRAVAIARQVIDAVALPSRSTSAA
jgi:hypothetical protein